jgi:polyisoprenoid-binding protein YceI
MATQRFDIDTTHSGVHFTVRHLVISKVRGRFTRFSGTVWLDDQNPAASRVEAFIDADSVDTNEPKRDGHLRSPDFFDVAQFPQITFQSTRVEAAGAAGAGGELRVTGDLTIHGVTRPVTLAAESLGRAKDPWGGERAGFSAKLSVDRKDFGLQWNMALEAGGFVVGDKIDIELEVEAVKAVAAAAA